MNIADKDIEYIERYFNLELSEEELSVFETRLEHEPGFAGKLDRYKKSMDLVDKEYTTDIEKERVKKWKKIITNDKESKTILLPWKWIAGIAASVALIFFGWQYTNNVKQQDLAKITQDAWNKKIGLDYRMMRTTDRDSLQQVIVSAFDAYEAEKYTEAISILESFIPTILYYEDALLIRGLSQYRLGNVNEGLKSLETLSNHPTGKKAKVALWYRGLIYLETGDKKAAQEFLVVPNDEESTITLKE